MTDLLCFSILVLYFWLHKWADTWMFSYLFLTRRAACCGYSSTLCSFYLTECPANHFISVHRDLPQFFAVVMYFIVWRDHSLSHSSVLCWHVSCFWCVAIIDNTMMNSIMLVYFMLWEVNCLGKSLEVNDKPKDKVSLQLRGCQIPLQRLGLDNLNRTVLANCDLCLPKVAAVTIFTGCRDGWVVPSESRELDPLPCPSPVF